VARPNKALQGTFDPPAALDTAQAVEDVDIPGYRLHKLKGREKHRWSIWVNGNWRLTFEFREGDVHIIDYEDYH
jgi:proteic killer suppression protein